MESIYRKIRSEAISKTDLFGDDIDDLRLLFQSNQRTDDPYIQYFNEPCDIGLFSKRQIEVSRKTIKHNNNLLVCYLDATGSIVRKIPSINKYLYYYALVIKDCKGKTFPIAERITSNHDAASIGNWLMKFKQLGEVCDAWPIFNILVTDFNRALINGAMLNLNQCDLIT